MCAWLGGWVGGARRHHHTLPTYVWVCSPASMLMLGAMQVAQQQQPAAAAAALGRADVLYEPSSVRTLGCAIPRLSNSSGCLSGSSITCMQHGGVEGHAMHCG